MTIERLTEAIRVVKGVKPKYFDLNFWSNRCGTVGCVLGHCAVDPWFVARGLSANALHGCPNFRDFIGFGAATQFFGLHSNQAHQLFSPAHHPHTTGAKGKRSAISAIEKFIRELEAA